MPYVKEFAASCSVLFLVLILVAILVAVAAVILRAISRALSQARPDGASAGGRSYNDPDRSLSGAACADSRRVARLVGRALDGAAFRRKTLARWRAGGIGRPPDGRAAPRRGASEFPVYRAAAAAVQRVCAGRAGHGAGPCSAGGPVACCLALDRGIESGKTHGPPEKLRAAPAFRVRCLLRRLRGSAWHWPRFSLGKRFGRTGHPWDCCNCFACDRLRR